MAKNAATHPSPATSSASQPAASRPTLAPVIEINVRHIGRTPHPEKLIGGEAPEGWIKKIDRPREGKVWVGFFHLYVADRVMYVPPIVKRRIEELGIGRGELFTLTKAEKKNGTRCTIEWLVDAGDRREKPPRGNVPTATGQRPAQQRDGAGVSGNGNGQRANSTHDAKGFLVTNHGQLLLQSMAAAVDVGAATERYAAAAGVDVQFTSEDLREIGLRIYAAGLK